MEDIYLNNQRNYCITNKLPMFAHTKCFHDYAWCGNRYADAPNTFGEMLVYKYGDEKAFIKSTSELITSCPVCNRSWCD
jgi:hypothetical protein